MRTTIRLAVPFLTCAVLTGCATDIPLSHVANRPTPLHFGLYVTPEKNPLPKPERFIGYHTGLDFEVGSDEINTDVAVRAFCDGTVLASEFAEGYGGVLVQSCAWEGEDVTVLYGHLRPSSLVAKGTVLKTGDAIGALGNDHSTETDGNRKHLHFSIHKGKSVVLLGYVQDQSRLSEWIDPETVLFPGQDRTTNDAPLPGSSDARSQ